MAQTQGAETTKENKDDKKSSSGENNLPKKIVIRRLPPTLTKEQFLDIVSPLPEYDYLYFCNVDQSLGSFGFTRAYIYFKNYEDIFSFRDRFDNYVFVDSKSNEYPAIVEFAPYQRRLAFMTPDGEKNVKKDSKCNTIDQDSDYLKFVENFDKPSAAQLPTCEAMLEELEQREKEKLSMGGDFSAPKVMTPLLEFLKKKRDDKRSSKDKDRDRDRDRGGNRRRDDRDRDRDRDDKRYGKQSNSKQSNRDRDRDKDRDRDNYSSKSSNQKSSNKSSSSNSDYSNVKILSKSSSNKNDSQLNTNDSKSSSNKPSSNQSNRNNNNNNNQKDSNNSSSANSNKNSFSNSNSNNTNKQSNSTKPSSSSSNRERENNNEYGENKDNKPLRNKDRPSIQIYVPGQRAAQRQQGSSSSSKN